MATTMRRYGSTPERRRQLREQQTDAEAKLWYFLKSRHLDGIKFRRQHSLGPYILDFIARPPIWPSNLTGANIWKSKQRTMKRERPF
ncbi:MAG TPA: DUF559 domain-containing protein [Chloroflexota bacterium]|jgi:very-short-patch-repair endonuclease